MYVEDWRLMDTRQSFVLHRDRRPFRIRRPIEVLFEVLYFCKVFFCFLCRM